ncbi:2OG-Fe(II) oxygenase [Brevundimonas subvibrioides]|uniref:Prolyl 4-hydroxylase alpha subunit n=1 Tax=Brevundimonas subvibrioides (strain ATCC 15264 / DSM 4735 / LMG 14903 / NBRC 16000 / CB 81) TaxID=633149 RepID=D9QHB1_BRESC|nr:2OG-Fe(II) oxygenase family protein [Brevundimonas subvibrioides]ADL01077.1 Prolyl 4-hydroxylase alpha subunit [Brevundimonas subvibrioides ATCC 15264]
MAYAIDPALDAARMAPVFRRFGRLHVPGLLQADGAARLVEALDAAGGWTLSTRGATSTVDIPVEAFARADAPARAALADTARQEARTGFHYLFETLRVSDLAETGAHLPDPLRELYQWLNSPAFLGFAAEISGFDDLAYVDAQATRFRPGHYLTEHDDEKPDAGRRLAYVLNLSPGWRPSWGGLLGFIDADGHLAEAYTPAFNALNLFRTPQPHLVTQVADFAGGTRLSITGWIRTNR